MTKPRSAVDAEQAREHHRKQCERAQRPLYIRMLPLDAPKRHEDAALALHVIMDCLKDLDTDAIPELRPQLSYVHRMIGKIADRWEE